MAATNAARSSFLRPIFRTATTTKARTRIPFSVPNPSFRQARISPSPLSRLVRRELSSLQLVHGAIASACLVSKLPCHANSCAEGKCDGAKNALDGVATTAYIGACLASLVSYA